jgi:hypothetical protein
MKAIHCRRRRLPALAAIVATLAFTACTDETPLAPGQNLALRPEFSALQATAELNETLAELRHATARYHDIQAAKADGFALLHECETRDGEGVGAVYANMKRVMDGVADPKLPDALVYEPGKNGKLELVAAELVIPYALWTGSEPPEFFGNEFQREDEFGVYGLHIWIWRHNPNGMFAETNPRVSCDS